MAQEKVCIVAPSNGAPQTMHPPLSLKQIILAAREFQERDQWIVDNSNCLAAILALRDKQPSELYLIARDDTEEDMPIEVVQEMSRITKDCTISMRFVDSFLRPGNTATDQERLACIRKKKDKGSFTIQRFYGYLAKEDIAKLLTTSDSIISLGLAIRYQSDSATISSLQAWNNLENINVSVKIDMDVNDLMPLHPSFSSKEICLTFPFLTDELVDNVRPVIDVLMRDLTPGKKIFGLYFPKSRLTAAGALRLGLGLKSLEAKGVGIEPCENWKPDQKEENYINVLFQATDIVKENVKWNVDWLYKESIMKRKQQEVRPNQKPKKRKIFSFDEDSDSDDF